MLQGQIWSQMIQPYLMKEMTWWLVTHRNHLGKRLPFFYKNDPLEEDRCPISKAYLLWWYWLNSKPAATKVLSRLHYYIQRQICAMNKERCKAAVLEILQWGWIKPKLQTVDEMLSFVSQENSLSASQQKWNMKLVLSPTWKCLAD